MVPARYEALGPVSDTVAIARHLVDRRRAVEASTLTCRQAEPVVGVHLAQMKVIFKDNASSCGAVERIYERAIN